MDEIAPHQSTTGERRVKNEDRVGIERALSDMSRRLQNHWAKVCAPFTSGQFEARWAEVLESLQKDREVLVMLHRQCGEPFMAGAGRDVLARERYITGRFDECLSLSYLEESAVHAHPTENQHALCTMITLLQRAVTLVGGLAAMNV